MDDIKKMLTTLLKSEKEPDLIQVTGGEPSTHPQIMEILTYLKNSPVRHLMLNTNGIRIAEEESFVKSLKGLGAGFEVYLQFDSLQSERLQEIRARDMREVREAALERLERHNISTTLVCVIKKGLNDQEIPELIEFARKYRCIRGLVFQPIQDAGRIESEDDFRLTLSEIRESIIKDATNPFESDDMIPLPCDPHKICVGYAAKNFKEGYADLMPVTGKLPKSAITEHRGTVSFEQDRDFVKNVVETINLETAMGEAILKDKIKQKLFCCWPSFLTPKNMGYEHVFRVVIMEFSDLYNFDTTNIKRECNFMVEPERLIPFSTHNMGIPQSQ